MKTGAKTSELDSRWMAILGLYVATAAWAVVQLFVADHGGVYILFWLASAVPPTLWMVIDAKRRARPIPSGLQIMFLFFWPIVVLGYLIATRGLHGVGLFCCTLSGQGWCLSVFFYGTI